MCVHHLHRRGALESPSQDGERNAREPHLGPVRPSPREVTQSMSKREPPVAAQDRDTPAPSVPRPNPEAPAPDAASSERRSTTLQWNPSIGLGSAPSGAVQASDSASISGARRVAAENADAVLEPPRMPLSELRPDADALSRATLPSAIDTPPSSLTRADAAPPLVGHATPVVPGLPPSARSVEAPTPPSTRLFGTPSRRTTPPPLPKVPGAMPARSLTPGPRPMVRSMTPPPGNSHPTPRSLSPSPRRDQAITPRPSASPAAQGATATSTDADPRGTKNPALRATGFSGLSQGVPLSHWLELVQIGRRDAVISLRTKNGDESHIWCRQGEIVDAQTGSLLGEDAVYCILELEDGDVSIEFTPCERPKTIATPTFALMLEASRRKDHAAESSGPRAVPKLHGERMQSDDTPVSRPITGVARPYDTRITSNPPDAGVVSSTRPHVTNFEPSSQRQPSNNQWKHPHAFGIAFALVCGGLALWLLWRPGNEAQSPALKPPSAPLAKPAPAPHRPPTSPAATAAPPPRTELADDAPPAPTAPVVAAAPARLEPEPAATETVERARAAAPARPRRATHNPAPAARVAVKETSTSEPTETATPPVEAKKEEPRVRLIEERKPRVQVIEELPPDVRVIE